MTPEFIGFPKIARLHKPYVITEKIDGTNAQICITEDGDMFAGSRSRWLTPENDNFGFCKWAEVNKEELLKLGPGRHFGEWWGHGINRGYGLKEKRFSLFNTSRWHMMDPKPDCCHVVPVIMSCDDFFAISVTRALCNLRTGGSLAAPGFMEPEGVVVYHAAANICFKVTFDDRAKSS